MTDQEFGTFVRTHWKAHALPADQLTPELCKRWRVQLEGARASYDDAMSASQAMEVDRYTTTAQHIALLVSKVRLGHQERRAPYRADYSRQEPESEDFRSARHRFARAFREACASRSRRKHLESARACLIVCEVVDRESPDADTRRLVREARKRVEKCEAELAEHGDATKPSGNLLTPKRTERQKAREDEAAKQAGATRQLTDLARVNEDPRMAAMVADGRSEQEARALLAIKDSGKAGAKR